MANIIEKQLNVKCCDTRNEKRFCEITKLSIDAESKKLLLHFDNYGDGSENIDSISYYCLSVSKDLASLNDGGSFRANDVSYTKEENNHSQGTIEYTLSDLVIGKCYAFAATFDFSRQLAFTIDQDFLQWTGPVIADLFDDGRTSRNGYDPSKYCKVRDVRVNAEENVMTIKIAVFGTDDNDCSLRGDDYNTLPQLSLEWESETEEKRVGTIRYSLIHFKKGQSYSFSYGCYGFSAINNLIVFDEEFMTSLCLPQDMFDDTASKPISRSACTQEDTNNSATVYKIRGKDGKFEVFFEARGENLPEPCGKEVKDSDGTDLPLSFVKWFKKGANVHCGALVYDPSVLHRGEQYVFSYGPGFSKVWFMDMDNDTVNALGLAEVLPVIDEPTISRITYKYFCEITKMESDKTNNLLLVHFESHGNEFINPLRKPTGGELSDNEYHSVGQLPTIFHKETDRLISGTFRYLLGDLKMGTQYNFTYFHGYSTISPLFTFDQAFVQKLGISDIARNYAAGPGEKELQNRMYIPAEPSGLYICRIFKMSVDKSTNQLRVYLEARMDEENGQVPKFEGFQLKDFCGQSVPNFPAVWQVQVPNFASGYLAFDLTKLQRDEPYELTHGSGEDERCESIFTADDAWVELFGLQEMLPKRNEPLVSRKDNYFYTKILGLEIVDGRRLLIHYEARGKPSMKHGVRPVSEPDYKCVMDSKGERAVWHPFFVNKVETEELILGTLSFGIYNFKLGEKYYFRHSEDGYSTTELFTWTEEFAKAHAPAGVALELCDPEEKRALVSAFIKKRDAPTNFANIYKVTADPENKRLTIHWEAFGKGDGPLPYPSNELKNTSWSVDVAVLESKIVVDQPDNGVLAGSWTVDATKVYRWHRIEFEWAGDRDSFLLEPEQVIAIGMDGIC